METYKIKVDRQKVYEFSQKGRTKCEGDNSSYYKYKKGSLFKKQSGLKQEGAGEERKALIDRIMALLKIIEEE
jgi:hypothetical protein